MGDHHPLVARLRRPLRERREERDTSFVTRRQNPLAGDVNRPIPPLLFPTTTTKRQNKNLPPKEEEETNERWAFFFFFFFFYTLTK
jgi:hypothetical protein